MNYLFLDIDAVLDPEAVKNLEHIIEATEAKIIITSTKQHDGDIQALWRNRNLAGDVVGVTPTVQKEKAIGKIKIRYGHRGMEVDKWLQDNAAAPYKYAILDDEDDYLPSQSDHLVLTDPMTGITKEVADKVISLLD